MGEVVVIVLVAITVIEVVVIAAVAVVLGETVVLAADNVNVWQEWDLS